jgi:hypothetical protein
MKAVSILMFEDCQFVATSCLLRRCWPLFSTRGRALDRVRVRDSALGHV